MATNPSLLASSICLSYFPIPSAPRLNPDQHFLTFVRLLIRSFVHSFSSVFRRVACIICKWLFIPDVTKTARRQCCPSWHAFSRYTERMSLFYLHFFFSRLYHRILLLPLSVTFPFSSLYSFSIRQFLLLLNILQPLFKVTSFSTDITTISKLGLLRS